MPNRLATQSSPYLRQHGNNPVDWYPWGEEALERARREDRPILLSVGYSACHWCHVMESESFEDPDTAAYMNEHFVNVKVDREERPDIDALYMEAVQQISGQGGWPMTVFLDPDCVPFFGGTYFPPDEGRGMPSFRMVMEAVVEAFAGRREQIRERAGEVRARLAGAAHLRPAPSTPGEERLREAIAKLLGSADRRHGGFGGAPKFPPASALELLLARARGRADREEAAACLAAVEDSLDAMLAGGIYDQLGGGFARYSVDAAWRVPHFEKMLYDNALLARAYLHGWQALGHDRYRRICEETIGWMLEEMLGPEGGFYAALDADSEGEEGRFYTWTPAQVRAAIAAAGNGNGDDAAELALEHFGVAERGNFGGASVLHLAGGPRATLPSGLEWVREALLRARAERPRPGLDDKRLTAWNALAIAALAETGAVLGCEDYLAAARRCAEFVLNSLRDERGRLLRTFKDGRASLNAYLEDHAFLLDALLVLYEADLDRRWYEEAEALATAMVERFHDAESGGFFSTSDDHEELIARRKELGDHPIPSGNSAAAFGLLRLAALSGERRHGERAEEVLALFAGPALEHPESFAHLLRALDFQLAPTHEIALVATATASPRTALAPLLATVRAELRPHQVLAAGAEGAEQPPLLANRGARDGAPTAYVCRGFSCRAPVTDPAALDRQLANLD